MQPGGVILVPLEESAPELWSPKIQRAWMLESWGPQREVEVCGVYGQQPTLGFLFRDLRTSWKWMENARVCFHCIFSGASDPGNVEKPIPFPHRPMSPGNDSVGLATWGPSPSGREKPSLWLPPWPSLAELGAPRGRAVWARVCSPPQAREGTSSRSRGSGLGLWGTHPFGFSRS